MLKVTVYFFPVDALLAVMVTLIVPAVCDEGTLPLSLLPDRDDCTHDVLGLLEIAVTVSLEPCRYWLRSISKPEPIVTG